MCFGVLVCPAHAIETHNLFGVLVFPKAQPKSKHTRSIAAEETDENNAPEENEEEKRKEGRGKREERREKREERREKREERR